MTDNSVPYAPDPRAVRLAKALRSRVAADNIILFGSRARGGWRPHSDIDLLIVQAPASERDRIQGTAHALASAIFGQPKPDIDFVYRTHRECRIQIQHSVNGIADVALREGVAAEPYPRPWNDPEPEPEPEMTECGEMTRRLIDANRNYDALQYLLDGRRANNEVAAHARQTLEHALKALISAQRNPYQHTHRLDDLRQTAGLDSQALGSDLGQLDPYAGGAAYFDPERPIEDFAAMANAVTDDLILIYAQIADLTGLDAWTLQPPGTPPVQPIYR